MKYPRNYPPLPPRNEIKTNVGDYTAVAMSALRRLSPTFRQELQRNGVWDDVVAWAGVAAVEGQKMGWDQRDTYNAAQRYIYHALRAAGYVRPKHSKGYEAKEYPFDIYPESSVTEDAAI